MPGRPLPTFLTSDVASRNSKKSCYVTMGTNVYDVTLFLDEHPGGGDLILEYGGKDVTEIMGDEISHSHSESAYEFLEDYRVGFIATEPVMKTVEKSSNPQDIIPFPPNEAGIKELKDDDVLEEIEPGKLVYRATGMSSEADLYRNTDTRADFRKHGFLDLDKPLLMQVWNGGFSKDFYLEQVHRPRNYNHGASAQLFGNFLEPLSKTPWWLVPVVWLPPVFYVSYLAYQQLPTIQWASYWLFGFGLWSLVEYGLHRGLFHVDKYLPDNRVGITLHFLLHGIHHYLPMDRLRLVMPPTLFVVLATPFYRLALFIFYWDWYVAMSVFCGGIFGYVLYDETHYFLHHSNLPLHYRQLRKYHMQHHFADYENGFGVTSRFWDRVFGTELEPPRAAKAA